MLQLDEVSLVVRTDTRNTHAIDGSKPIMLNAIPKTYEHDSIGGHWQQENESITSSGVKALLNSCLYPSSARSCSSAVVIASFLVMVVDGRYGAGVRATASYRRGIAFFYHGIRCPCPAGISGPRKISGNLRLAWEIRSMRDGTAKLTPY